LVVEIRKGETFNMNKRIDFFQFGKSKYLRNGKNVYKVTEGRIIRISDKELRLLKQKVKKNPDKIICLEWK
jgi:hypothetical protein